MMKTVLVLALQVVSANTPDNLKETMADLQKYIQAGDAASAAPIARSLLCDDKRLRNALRPDADPAALAKIVEMHKVLSEGSNEKALNLFKAKPEQSEIRIVGATTEEIVEKAKGGDGAKFPGGARDLAATILRPGMKFYQVEFLEPGQTSGLKFHLFFWDGKSWAMVGAAWRVVKKK